MIAYAACVADPGKLARCAGPGLRRAMRDGDVFAELTTSTSIHEAYDEALAHFGGVTDLEALVLLHEDTEILTADFGDRVRAVLADPSVAIAGAVGARGVTSIAWWEGSIVGAVTETRGTVAGRGFGDVDALDGLLLALSPWAVANLRCDPARYPGFHAYDVDLCFAARAAGRRVVAADLPVFHHTKGGYGDRAAWAAADAAFKAKWLGAGAAAA